MTEETTPQRARRFGKDYADRFHDQWSNKGRNWIRLAFAAGYMKACEDLLAAIDDIEETLVYDDYIAQLDEVLQRFEVPETAA